MTLTPSQSVRLFRGPSPRRHAINHTAGRDSQFPAPPLPGAVLYSGQSVESSGSLRLKNWLPVPPFRQYIEHQSIESSCRDGNLT